MCKKMQLQCENFGFPSSIGNHLKPSIIWETNLHLLRLGLRRKYYIKLMKKKKGNSELETHHRKDREANFRVDSGTELLGKRVLSGD